VFALLAFVLSFFIIDRRGGKFIDGLKEVIIKDRVFKKEITDFLHKTELIKFSIPLFFISFCAEFLIMSLSLFLNELGADFVLIGLIFSLFHIPVIFESYFSVVADKKGKKPIMLKGLIFGSLFFLLLFFTENIVFLFSICFFLSLCFSAIIPALQGKIIKLMPKKSIGELTGVVRSVGLFGNGLGPIVVGIISDIFGLRFAFLLGSLIFLFLTAFTLLLKF